MIWMEQKGVQIDTEMSESVPESSNFPALHTSRVWVYGKWSTPCPSCAKYHVMLLTSVPSFRSFGVTEAGEKVGRKWKGGAAGNKSVEKRWAAWVGGTASLLHNVERWWHWHQNRLRCMRIGEFVCMGAVAMGKELNM